MYVVPVLSILVVAGTGATDEGVAAVVADLGPYAVAVVAVATVVDDAFVDVVDDGTAVVVVLVADDDYSGIEDDYVVVDAVLLHHQKRG